MSRPSSRRSSSRSSKTRDSHEPGRREQRKQRTRHSLMNATLELMQGEKSFNSISLREVARRAGVVPTAFYRHFSDMDELGMALVDDALKALRGMMREARAETLSTTHLIQRSVKTYLSYAEDNRLYFQFLAKERFGGSRALRNAIRQGILLFTSELATDLARFPHLNRMSIEELQMMSGLIVSVMVSSTETLLDLPDDDPEERAALQRSSEEQIRLIFLGMGNWKPKVDRKKAAEENTAET